MTKLFVTLLLLFSFALLNAQDKIHLRSGKVIQGKITEVGVDVIKYKIDPAEDAVVFSVRKMDVMKVEFENGRVEKYSENWNDPALYAGQKRRMIKLEFISPILGYTGIGYEQSIRPGINWETSIGLIGLGFDRFRENPRGANIKTGVRFFKSPDFKKGTERYWHLLSGSYIKPEILAGRFDRSNTFTWYDYKHHGFRSHTHTQTVTYGVVNMVLGKQMVVDEVFALDVYAGVGYGFVKTTNIPDRYLNEQYYNHSYYYYGASILHGQLPFSYTMGVKLGYLF